MSNWKTDNAPSWYLKLYWAIWNSIIALWDDLVVTWDAAADHDWKTDNEIAWKIKNTPEWRRTAVGTWYVKN